MLVPLPAVVEAYSVLTRLPAPHRMSPQDACGILASLLSDTARIVGLDGGDAWGFLLDAAAVQAAERRGLRCPDPRLRTEDWSGTDLHAQLARLRAPAAEGATGREASVVALGGRELSRSIRQRRLCWAAPRVEVSRRESGSG